MSDSKPCRNRQEFLSRYHAALKAKADAEVELQFLEAQLRLGLPDGTPSKQTEVAQRKMTRVERFVEENSERLNQSDRAFLDKKEASTAEVAKYTGLKKDKIIQRLNSGIYRPGPSHIPGSKNRYDTFSVVEVRIGVRHD